MLVKIEGQNHLYRDTNTMALVNKDMVSRDEYFMKRKLLTNQKTEINNVKSEIQSIKDDILEVKQLLAKLLEGPNV